MLVLQKVKKCCAQNKKAPECLPSKLEALSSNPSTAKKKKKKKKERKKEGLPATSELTMVPGKFSSLAQLI
jgi:hypothetical protein